MRARKSKGQAAVEFLAYATFFMFFFAFSTYYFASQQEGELNYRQNQIAKEIGTQYADYVDFAVGAGDGFRGNFTIPKNLGGSAYEAKFGSDGFVYLNWSNTRGQFSYPYPTSTNNTDIADGAPSSLTRTPPLVAGTNSYINIDVSKGEMTLINQGGKILINQS